MTICRPILVILIVLLCHPISAVRAQSEDNLLLNGDFSDGLANWDQLDTPWEGNNGVWPTEVAGHPGGTLIAYDSGYGGGNKLRQTISLEPGVYTMSLSVYGSGSAWVKIYIRDIANQTICMYQHSGGTWTVGSRLCEITLSDTYQFLIEISPPWQERWWIDDAVIEFANDLENIMDGNLLRNPNFNNGSIYGWVQSEGAWDTVNNGIYYNSAGNPARPAGTTLAYDSGYGGQNVLTQTVLLDAGRYQIGGTTYGDPGNLRIKVILDEDIICDFRVYGGGGIWQIDVTWCEIESTGEYTYWIELIPVANNARQLADDLLLIPENRDAASMISGYL